MGFFENTGNSVANIPSVLHRGDVISFGSFSDLTWVLPYDISVKVTAMGGSSNSGKGGKGGLVYGEFFIKSGNTLNFKTGTGGVGGSAGSTSWGGNSGGNGARGGSGVQILLNDSLVIASGGGGGAGGKGGDSPYGTGYKHAGPGGAGGKGGDADCTGNSGTRGGSFYQNTYYEQGGGLPGFSPGEGGKCAPDARGNGLNGSAGSTIYDGCGGGGGGVGKPSGYWAYGGGGGAGGNGGKNFINTNVLSNTFVGVNSTSSYPKVLVEVLDAFHARYLLKNGSDNILSFRNSEFINLGVLNPTEDTFTNLGMKYIHLLTAPSTEYHKTMQLERSEGTGKLYRTSINAEIFHNKIQGIRLSYW